MPTPAYERWKCQVVSPTDMSTVIWEHSAATHMDIDTKWKNENPDNPTFINMVKLNRAATHKTPHSLIKVYRIGKLSEKLKAKKYGDNLIR